MRKVTTIIILVICLTGMGVGGYLLFNYIADVLSQNKQYEEISSDHAGEYKERQVKYNKLKKKNPDMAGWIRMEQCKIDYPILKPPFDDDDFYLTHDFKKKYSKAGSLFTTPYTDIDKPSDNIILYGHKMTVGTMFRQLEKYKEKSFYKKNPYFYVDTMEEPRKYEIAYVFKINTNNDPFEYYKLIDAKDDSEFNEYTQNCKERQLYKTGVKVGVGDKLVTLSTCEYSSRNGRFVIVAKQVELTDSTVWKPIDGTNLWDRLNDVMPFKEIVLGIGAFILLLIAFFLVRAVIRK